MLALTPAWSPPQEGISTVIVPEKYRIKSGEDLNLFVDCRNVSNETITLKYADWPLATHTYWELNIVPKGGTQVPSAKHPTLTPESINDYFSKFPRTYEVKLEPKQEFFQPLQRINSAKPGWGYKEELDFKYYPMGQPGKYDIAATAHNFRPGKEIVAKGLRVWVE